MMTYFNFLLVFIALVHSDPDLEFTKGTPTYRDSAGQATIPTKLADPSFGVYTKGSASYRTNGPSPQTDGLIQNITVVVPKNPRLPAKVFYDQLAQGKTPRKCSKRSFVKSCLVLTKKRAAICCAQPGWEELKFLTLKNNQIIPILTFSRVFKSNSL
jgi:hypothetical protein